MEVLLVSPVRPLRIVVAKMIPYFLLSCVNLATILLLARFVLGVPMSGSVVGLVGLSLLYLVLADVPSESEIGIGRDALHLPAHRFGRMGRDDGEVDVVDLDRNGEAEQQQLHHGHQQHDEHRAPVAQDVQRLLSDEREESFHLIPSVWPCGPGCGTPRPSTLRHIVLSIRPEFPARGSARRP